MTTIIVFIFEWGLKVTKCLNSSLTKAKYFSVMNLQSILSQLGKGDSDRRSQESMDR